RPNLATFLMPVGRATLTGILYRLQRGGWITRERVPDAADRRAVIVQARRERNPELFQLFSGMNAQMDEPCKNYTDDELELAAGNTVGEIDPGPPVPVRLRSVVLAWGDALRSPGR